MLLTEKGLIISYYSQIISCCHAQYDTEHYSLYCNVSHCTATVYEYENDPHPIPDTANLTISVGVKGGFRIMSCEGHLSNRLDYEQLLRTYYSLKILAPFWVGAHF